MSGGETWDMQKRLLALEFDHDVFRMWPTGPLADVLDVVHDEGRLRAATQRLEAFERIESGKLSPEQRYRIAHIVHECCERARRQHR